MCRSSATTAGSSARPSPAKPRADANLAQIDRFLQRVGIGLAALDRAGNVLCANEGARRLLARRGSGRAGLRAPRAVARAARRLGRQAPGTPSRLRLVLGSATLRVLLWPAAAGLVGLRLHREQWRAAAVELLLARRLGLSRLQARAAVLIARGHTNAETAGVMQTTERAVRGLCDRICSRTGTRGRVQLADLVAELVLGLP